MSLARDADQRAGLALAQGRVSTAENGVMLEILQNFESTVGEAARLRPLVVVGSGAAAVAVGLCVWLGGLSLRKLLVGIAGAIIGAALGFILLGGDLLRVAGPAVAATVIARVFEKVFVTVMAAALAASIGFAVLAGPELSSGLSDGGQSHSLSDGSDKSDRRGLWHSDADVAGTIKRAARLMPPQKLAIIALLAVIFLVGGLVLWRPTAALCFSVIGTILIFAGMILLLVYKGAAPVGLISSRPVTYAGVFAAMALFGTLEQLLLCRVGKKQTARPEKPKRKSRRA